MSDFADIPAAGDAAAYSDEEMEEDVESGSEPDEEGKYRFNGKHIYVTWSKSDRDELGLVLEEHIHRGNTHRRQ